METIAALEILEESWPDAEGKSFAFALKAGSFFTRVCSLMGVSGTSDRENDALVRFVVATVFEDLKVFCAWNEPVTGKAAWR